MNIDLLDRLPVPLQPYARLARLDKPIGIWLLLLPGWWAIFLASGGISSMTVHRWWLVVLFAAGAVIMRAAGCVVNDLWDRKIDRQVARTRGRPLASGEIKIWQALLFLGLLLCLGLMILLQMNFLTRLLGFAVLPLIVAYPLMKRITWWPQAFLGITFNFGALMGWSAVTGGLGLAPLLLYAGGILWTLGYDTIYAHQDIQDDALIGIKSTARLFAGRSKKAVALFYGGAWIMMACAALAGAPYSFAFMILLLSLVHLAGQIWLWRPDDPGNCQKIFNANRDFGLIVLAAFVLN